MPSKKPFESYTSKALSEKQIRAMHLVCDNLEDDLLLTIAIEFGLRRGDLISLKIVDIDLENGKLHFYEQKKDKNRSLPIKDEIAAKIRQYLNTLPSNQKLLFELSEKGVYNRINNLYAKAGYSKKIAYIKNGHANIRFEPTLPVHALRGTCYKRLRAEGKTLEFCAAWLGDSVSVAAEHYGKVTDAELEDAIRQEQPNRAGDPGERRR